MEPVEICVLVSIVLAVFAVVAYILRFKKQANDGDNGARVDVARVNQPPVRQGPRRVAGARARQVRNRLAPARAQDDSDEEVDFDPDTVDLAPQHEGKIGAKKLRKLQLKEERAAQREAEADERRERQERQAALEKKRQKEEQLRQKEEAAKEAEEQRLKEEQARHEHEEYLKLKETFSLLEEGTDAVDEQDMESLLREFINYIEENKVVMLEDLACHFKIKTQDAIDRVKTLQAEGQLSGVIDDRGKFISITRDEYETVARFIQQRGRVSISELADNMNRLIRLQPTVTASTNVAANA